MKYIIFFQRSDIGTHHERFKHLDRHEFTALNDQAAFIYAEKLQKEIEKNYPHEEILRTDTRLDCCLYEMKAVKVKKTGNYTLFFRQLDTDRLYHHTYFRYYS